MARGPARKEAQAALQRAGFTCRRAREPYEGTARFVEQPADLVVLSLDRFRTRDIDFVSTVRKRSPETRILLLVSEGRRSLAVRALEAGADAYVLQPFFGVELATVADRLVRAPGGREAAAAEQDTLARLAGEVSHAVNNPLQVLSLMTEAEDDPGRKGSLESEVARVRDVVEILGRYGHRGAPAKDRGLLGPLLAGCVDRHVARGAALAEGPPPDDGPAFAFDAEQVGLALDDLAGLILAQAPSQPVPLAARIRARTEGARPVVEAALRGRDVHLEAGWVDGLRRAVLWSHLETRAPHPGLALVEAVAREHRGHVRSRETRGGTVLALELAVP